MGGSVILEGQRRPIADLALLPTSGFRIHALNFTGITQWGFSLEDDLRRLPSLPHLKELYINGRLWYDQPIPLVASTMGLFSACTELEKLVLSKPVQTHVPFDESVQGLQSLTGLHEFRAHQTRIAGASLMPFSALQYLDLNYDRTFNDEGMNSLQSMTALSKLYLRGTSISDAGLKNLSALTNLTELDLADTGVGDAGLSCLAALTKLRRLNLQTANVTDAGLDALHEAPDCSERHPSWRPAPGPWKPHPPRAASSFANNCFASMSRLLRRTSTPTCRIRRKISLPPAASADRAHRERRLRSMP